jgi:hypothetical protein
VSHHTIFKFKGKKKERKTEREKESEKERIVEYEVTLII